MKYIIILLFAILAQLEPSPKMRAVVTEVHDGDTFYIDIKNVHPVLGKRIPVRVKGIDTAELHSKKALIKEQALKAKEMAECKLYQQKIILSNITRDKYFRLNADVKILSTGEDFAKFMLDMELAKPYNGGTKEPE